MTDSELLLEIPSNFELILQRTPDVAAEWRFSTRTVLTSYLSRGYLIDDCFVDDDVSAFYHLTHSDLDPVLQRTCRP